MLTLMEQPVLLEADFKIKFDGEKHQIDANVAYHFTFAYFQYHTGD